MPPFLSENSVSALKVAHYGALFFKLLYIRLCKTYRRLYILKISLMSNRLARHTFVSIGVVQASRKITAGYSEYDKTGQGCCLI